MQHANHLQMLLIHLTPSYGPACVALQMLPSQSLPADFAAVGGEEEAIFDQCMPNGGLAGQPWASLHEKMIWGMVLFGSRGSMFRLHYDHTELAAWQLLLNGAKRFILCSPTATNKLSEIRAVSKVTNKEEGTGASWINPFDVEELRSGPCTLLVNNSRSSPSH
eukprot:SAG31_NODE_9064_length_1341_cov_1.286634_1_plen_164_part_00